MSQPNNDPFFIIGSERSGTTLLMVMLGNHPRLAVPEVTWYYPRFRAYLHTYGELNNAERFRELAEEMIFGLKTPLFGLPANPVRVVDEILSRVKERSFAALFSAIMGWYADVQKKPRWGEKTPHNLFYVREILEDFPTAKFVHLIRDGRDVAVEQIDSAFGPTNAFAAAKIWRNAIHAGDRAREITPQAQWLDVSYEELAHEPERILRQVSDFLGEEYSAEMLQFHTGEIAQRRGKTKDHAALGKPVSAEHVGKFKELLSIRDQRIFAGVAGAELLNHKYQIDVAPLELNAKQAALYDEWDVRVRAATLDAPGGHLVYESYNDWLADRREARRQAGLWTRDANKAPHADPLNWEEEFISGQRAPSYWKQRFAIRRQYTGSELVL